MQVPTNPKSDSSCPSRFGVLSSGHVVEATRKDIPKVLREVVKSSFYDTSVSLKLVGCIGSE